MLKKNPMSLLHFSYPDITMKPLSSFFRHLSVYRIRKVEILFCLFLTFLLTAFPPRVQALKDNLQQSFNIRQDYLYLFPHNGLVRKINKITGQIEWETQLMTFEGSSYPLTWSSFSTPVFVDNLVFTTDLFHNVLLGLDSTTGQVIVNDLVSGFFCSAPGFSREGFLFNYMETCGEFLLIFGQYGVESRGLHGQAVAVDWIFNCSQNDFYFLHDSFILDGSLYLYVSSPREGVSFDEAGENPRLLERKLLELDCATGKVLHRYGNSVFFGDKNIESWNLIDAGKWRGSELVLVKSGNLNYSLFAIDPISKQPTPVIAPLDDVGIPVWLDRGVKPVLLDNTIFYQLAEDYLIGRNLLNGKVVLKTKIAQGELLCTAAEGRLFNRAKQDDELLIICRDASTGDIRWRKEVNYMKEPQTSATIEKYAVDFAAADFEIEISEGRLYLLTFSYLYAFDAESGKNLWKISLKKNEDSSSKSKESIWRRIVDFFN